MSKPELLLVEDERLLSESLYDLLEVGGYGVTRVDRLGKAREELKHREFDLIILDLTLPDGSGLDFLPLLKRYDPPPVVLVLTGDVSLDTAVEAIRRGAFDYLTKPFDIQTLVHRIGKALEHCRAVASQTLRMRLQHLRERTGKFIPLVSESMAALQRKAVKIATYPNLPILITGETGVGKEYVCRIIHEASPQCDEPFIPINCATLERSFLRSELFGHERGAYTGADASRKGLLELAGRGTILLDEIGEMSLDIQANMLRFLETGRFRRLGGSLERQSEARFIGATNKNLEQMVTEKRFRADLFYRLNAVEIRVPPLRERPDDIRELAEHFCCRTSACIGICARLTPAAHHALCNYYWPGNVRELRHVVERAVLLSGEGDIQPQAFEFKQPRPSAQPEGDSVNTDLPFQTLANCEQAHIRRALDICKGNRTQAAKMLGIARSTLLRKLATSPPNSFAGE